MAFVRKIGETWAFTVEAGRDPVTGNRKRIQKSGFKYKREAIEAAEKAILEMAERVDAKRDGE